MRLGVAVLAYGDASYARVLDALLAAGIERRQIVVVHNPSEPDEAPLDTSVTVLRMPGNVGYGAAMNAAIRMRRSLGDELVLLLTHDAILSEAELTALITTADAAPRFGALGPVIQFTGPTSERLTFGGYHDPSGRVGHHSVPRPLLDLPSISECEWIDGCAMLLRLAALDEAGELDEAFFMYYEDNELCLRLRRAGWRVGVVLDARIESEPGKHRRPGATAFLFARNGLELQCRAGRRQLAFEVRSQLRGLLTPVRDLLAPRHQWTRRTAWAAICGKLAGWVAFGLRRFGPPPRGLPGMGDVRLG
jgi:GT2 family glycosyltransferase